MDDHRRTIGDANLGTASLAQAVQELESKLVQSLQPPEPPLRDF
jgi:hypothetical protein